MRSLRFERPRSAGVGRRHFFTGLLGVVACALVLAACGPRYQRIKVHEAGGLTIKLRSQKGSTREFSHPVTISGARLAHILSFIDVRAAKGSRKPAIPTEATYEIGEALSRAFSQAEPHQEVVVQAVRREKRMGLFTDKFLTSFVTYVEGDKLLVRLSRVDWQVPKGEEEDLPEPWAGKRVQSFRVMPSDHVAAVGSQGVSVLWKDPRFRRASNLHIGKGGRLGRKTVLLEGGDEDVLEGNESPDAPVLPKGLSPSQLRDLADLEERRSRGDLSEAEYHSRRREILEAASRSGD